MGGEYVTFDGVILRVIPLKPRDLEEAVNKADVDRVYLNRDYLQEIAPTIIVHGINNPSRGGGPRDIPVPALLVNLKGQYLWIPLSGEFPKSATANLPKLTPPYEPSKIALYNTFRDARGG